MSGTTGDNAYRASGVIAAASVEDISWQDIETGSTMTAVAGNGYWIDTTSNTCTITLPSSASNGDQIIFDDYARTWGTYGIIIDSNGLNYQGDDDTFDVEYGTDGQTLHIVYSGATNGWIPILDKDVADVPIKGNDNGIFGYGYTGSGTAVTNIVSNVGVVATDVTGVGTARWHLAATQYGGDKGIFGYGQGYVSMTNLVSNAGVVATDVTGVGTGRRKLAACSFGEDKGIFGYGDTPSVSSLTNLVSNVGVVATDVTGVGTARTSLAACEYGGDKGIFAYGYDALLLINLVSNVGVVATDTTGLAASGRDALAACSYGGDKGILGYGDGTGTPAEVATTNLISNVGVVAADVTGVGTVRYAPSACEYGKDKGIFGYGGPGYVSITNLVSNVGIQSSDVTGVGTVRAYLGGCSFN